MQVVIRGAKEADFPAIWEIFHSIVQKGDTYVFLPSTTLTKQTILDGQRDFHLCGNAR